MRGGLRPRFRAGGSFALWINSLLLSLRIVVQRLAFTGFSGNDQLVGNEPNNERQYGVPSLAEALDAVLDRVRK